MRAASSGVRREPGIGEQGFDLNIQRVLEHWSLPFAVREVIANALDEQILTRTGDPVIAEDADGRWHVRDFGRGFRYEHLTQNESAEKRRDPKVVGQFGMGLKDALAVFDRHDIGVEILSPHGHITTAKMAKAGFADVVTLHAVVAPPADPDHPGTDVVLTGVTSDQINEAKSFFLRFSGETVLETTRYGQVLGRAPGSKTARVYVKGLLVAHEENFLFSYNITDINAPLRKALNRERSNVGRTAYTDRVKKVMTAAGLVRRAGTNLNQAVARLNATGQQGEDLLPAARFCVRAVILVVDTKLGPRWARGSEPRLVMSAGVWDGAGVGWRERAGPGAGLVSGR